MNDQLLEYEQYFQRHQTIRIDFIADRKLSEITATVSSLSGDLIEIYLDADWPDDATPLDADYLIELRSGYRGSAFRCRALLVSDTSDITVKMRLVGNVILEELREFFRIDTYLPLRCYPMPDRDEKTVLRIWMEFTASLAEQLSTTSSFIYKGEPDPTASQRTPDAIPIQYSTPVAANISGGGLRTNIPDHLQPGSRAILELYLPGKPPRIIYIIGEVLTSAFVHSEDGGKTYSTPFKFIHLNENERDAVVSYIHRIQQRQISQIADSMPFDKPFTASQAKEGSKTGLYLFKALLLCVAVLIGVVLFDLYKKRGKSEVGLIFEKGLKSYLDKLSKQ